LLYPNPIHTGNTLFIENLTFDSPISFQLYSATGTIINELLKYNTSETGVIQLIWDKTLPKGVYFLKWTNGKQEGYKKVVFN
jgi:hypothetical protein